MSIAVVLDQQVLCVGFDRLEKKNAITAAMYTQLAQALIRAASDPLIKVVLLHGHETMFTAGNDIEDFLNNPPSGADSPVFHFLHNLATFPKPLIAAVSGAAIGVGTTMLMHCDVVYCAQNAQFATPFAQLGLCPEAASSLLFPQIAGYQRAAEAFLFGDRFDAEHARSMGLVNKVLPVDELMPYALQRAHTLAALPASSTRATKKLMKLGQAELIGARMSEESAMFGKMLKSPEAREAFGAFLQKRKPDFSKFD
jgi:enoyl-CoA hydratase/carnithine racemase